MAEHTQLYDARLIDASFWPVGPANTHRATHVAVPIDEHHHVVHARDILADLAAADDDIARTVERRLRGTAAGVVVPDGQSHPQS